MTDRGARPLHLQPRLIGLVLLGGLVGAPARYAVALALPPRSGQWPTATFAVNLAGAFALGLLLAALARLGPDSGRRRSVRLLVGTGFLGAVTTYSTLAVDTDLLVRDHQDGLAVGYAAASLVLGLCATLAGLAVAGLAVHGRSVVRLPVDPDAP